jgi:drug/metabolite transporter (DMT)-like permease
MDKNKFFTHPLVITLCALLCCALWGSATPFIKIGYELIMPHRGVPSTLVFAGVRFFGAGVLTVLIYSIGRKRVLYPKKENLGRVGIVACFQTIIQYIFFYIGLANTSGVKGTILSGSSTFFAILVSCLVFRMEKLNLKKIVACLLGFTGIILVNINGLTFRMNLLGDTFVLFSAISLAISSVLMKRFSKHEDPVILSGYQFILGGAVMTAVGFIAGGHISFPSVKSVLVMLYLSLLSAVAYALWGMLLKFNPVSKVTIFSFSTPIMGVLLSTLLLKEESLVTWPILLLTLLFISGGIFLLNYERKAPKAESVSKS